MHLVECVTVHHNKLICGAFDGTPKIWDLISGECLHTISRLHTRAVTSIIILSNEIFASSSKNKTIKLFDLNTFEFIKTISGHYLEVNSIVKVSNSKISSCSDDTTVRIWDINSGKCIKFLNYLSRITKLAVFKKNF